MRLYIHRNLPLHWIVGDKSNNLWLVPAISNGWAHRKPYVSNAAYLETMISSPYGIGLGIELSDT